MSKSDNSYAEMKKRWEKEEKLKVKLKIIFSVLLVFAVTAGAVYLNSQPQAIDVQVPKVDKLLLFSLDKDTPITKREIILLQGTPTKDVPSEYYEFTVPAVGDGSGRVCVVHDFGNRLTLYAYEIPTSVSTGLATAATVVNERKVLAVAKRHEVVKGKGIIIEEFHVNETGEPYFYCKSMIGFDGRKISESDQKGRKVTDYFALWGRYSLWL